MKNIKTLILLLIISTVFTVPGFSGCIKTRDDVSNGKNVIITTIVTIEDLAERIAGDNAEIMSLIPPGASPHSFEPTPGELEVVEQARMFIKVGSGIEFELEWTDRIIEMNQDMLVVDCSKGIDLIFQDEEAGEADTDENIGNDPHVWLSPVNAKIISQNIYEGFIEIDPENKEYYRDNLKLLEDKLDDLDKSIREILSGMENRKILVFHPAWTYFAAEYGLQQIAVQEEGKEPTIRSMESLIAQAKDEGISVIFASPEFDTRSAEVVASEIDGKVVLVSPLPQDYFSDMEKIARAFKESME
jgi:zinc transport system substrate-binding protein